MVRSVVRRALVGAVAATLLSGVGAVAATSSNVAEPARPEAEPSNPRPYDLAINGRTDMPIGVDVTQPRLSWKITSDVQSAYQIRAASSRERLGQPDLWDSGKVESADSIGVPYEGAPLQSTDRVYWQVRTWDARGMASAWSDPSAWEMGLLEASDWGDARWISHPTREVTDPLPIFARGFATEPGKTVDRARLYVTGLGIVHTTLNGEAVTDALMAPGQGNLQRSIEVGSHDVTDLVRAGDNTLAVALGNGPSFVRNVQNPATGRTNVYTKYQSTAPISTTLALPAAASTGTITVASGANLVPGATLHIDAGGDGTALESRRIAQVGEPTDAGTVVTLEEPLTRAHPAGAVVDASGTGLADAGRATEPRMLAKLVVHYSDGTTQNVVSDRSWRTALGPYVTEHWYAGDDYDARREQPGWNLPGADLSAEAARRNGQPTGWVQPALSAAPSLDTELVWRSAPPVRVVETYRPTVSEPVPGHWVFDFGQNFGGLVQLNVPGGVLPAGAVIKLKPGEKLDSDGSGLVDSSSLGSARGIFDTYTTSDAQADQSWVSPFRYTGVQWVEVTGLPEGFAPSADFVTGLQTRADVEIAGSVDTSSDLVNRLHRMSHHSIASNMQSVFTDCPSREKLGWTADVSQSLGAIDRQYAIGSFLPHMAEVMAEAQLPSGPNEGLVPDIAPEWTVFSGGFRDDINWGSTVVLVPWWLWKEHGDLDTAREHYDTMMRYWRYVRRVQAGTGAEADLVVGKLADWAADDTRTSGLLTGTAGYYTMTVKLQELAHALGHEADSAELAAKAADIKAAFNARFFNPGLHRYTNGGATGDVATQAAQALALDAGLVPADEHENVLDALVELIRGYNPNGGGPHPSGGMVSLGQTLRVLADNDRHDLLWEMLNQTTPPGWGYFVQPQPGHPDGLTTMPEFWDLRSSQNHMILLQIDEWFSAGLAGIQQTDDSTGYRHLVIDPAFVGTDELPLDHVSATYQTPYGEAASSWLRISNGQRALMEVTVPSGTNADAHLPMSADDDEESVKERYGDRDGVQDVRVEGDEAVLTLSPGTYRFVVTPSD